MQIYLLHAHIVTRVKESEVWIRFICVWQQCFLKLEELIVSFYLILKLQAGFCSTILSKRMVVICVYLEKSVILQSNGLQNAWNESSEDQRVPLSSHTSHNRHKVACGPFLYCVYNQCLLLRCRVFALKLRLTLM